MNRRTILLLLAAGCLAFAAYGSLVPMHFRPLRFDEALRAFFEAPMTPFRRASKSDVLSNVALLVPFGFFATAFLADRSRATAALLVPIVAIAGLVAAAAIEFGQVFVVGRTASWVDVWAQSVGAGVGAAGWALLARPVTAWLDGLLNGGTPRDTALRLLGLYAVAWVILSVLPFDFTIRPAELAAKWRRGGIVVAPYSTGAPAVAILEDAAGTMLRAVPIGALLLLMGRKSGRWDLGGSLLLGTLAVVSIECLQLLAVTRVADTGDVLAGVAGIAAGGAAAARWTRAGAAARGPAPPVRVWAIGLLAIWMLVLAVRHWSPFTFVTDPGFVHERLASMLDRVPFQSYYWSNPLAALAEALTKIMLGAPLGALLQLSWRVPSSPRAALAQAVVILVVSSILLTMIELGQLLVPTRIPDLTDVAVGAAGAAVGLAAVRAIQKGRTS